MIELSPKRIEHSIGQCVSSEYQEGLSMSELLRLTLPFWLLMGVEPRTSLLWQSTC